MPYWAELWPSGLALARGLPNLAGLDVVELGCGLGIPSLVAAARGARVTAVDWAVEAIDLLLRNAERNALEVAAVHADWSSFTGSFDVALGADLLYEERNGEALLEVLPSLAPCVLLADPGRSTSRGFFAAAAGDWQIEELGNRLYALTRTTPGGRRAHAGD
jgi:predicted nicotinamide N-methyase